MNRLLTIVDSKYQRLEYLESTGTQWIDTGIVSNGNITFDTTIKPIENTGVYLFGGGTSYNVDAIELLWYSFKTRMQFKYGNSAVTATTNNTAYQDKFRVYSYIEDNNYYVHFTDTDTKSTPVLSFTGQKIILFGTWFGNAARYFTSQRIYYFQIYDNGTLVRNMIPVLRKSDNEIGMLDLVEGKFYGNAGTGKFTANLDTMYALIQGSPTVQDGRVSGFSSSNYLKIGQISTVQNRLERQIKIKTSDTTGSTQTILSTGGYAGIRINDANQIGTLVYINGSYSNFTLNTVLNRNTEYIYKDVFENGTLTIYLYNYQMVLLETKSASIGFDENTNYNLGQSSGRIFLGSIDLNRSYIKINDTKYKLQAVVGYTKVGSPTIEDGVVSNFSTSNYLEINQNLSLYNTNFIFKLKINSGTGVSNEQFIFSDKVSSAGFAFSRNNTKFTLNYKGSNKVTQNTTYNIENNVDYDIEISIINNTLTWYINGSKITTKTTNYESYNISKLYIGSRTAQTYFRGSIDLKETYIKISNKLWFNGLEA